MIRPAVEANVAHLWAAGRGPYDGNRLQRLTSPARATQAVRFILDTFPGSTVEATITRPLDHSKGSTMQKTDTPAPAPFDEAGAAPPSKNLGDYDKHLVLILPQEEGMLSTSFGTADVIWSDVVVAGVGPNGFVFLPNTPVFWKGVQQQLAGKVGSGRWVAGNLRQLSRKDKAWALTDLSNADREFLGGLMTSEAFKAALEAPRPERQVPEDPF